MIAVVQLQDDVQVENVARVDAGGDLDAEPDGFDAGDDAGDGVDGADAGDSWNVYTTTTGIDPNPGVDVPTNVTMQKVGAFAQLQWAFGPYAGGADFRVLVRVKRASPAGESTNTAVTQHTLPDAPDSPDLDVFGGSIYWQK